MLARKRLSGIEARVLDVATLCDFLLDATVFFS